MSAQPAAYFVLTELLVRRPDELRPARLLTDVAGLSGTVYPSGTEVRVAGDGQLFDGFVDGDWLSLDPGEFELN